MKKHSNRPLVIHSGNILEMQSLVVLIVSGVLPLQPLKLLSAPGVEEVGAQEGGCNLEDLRAEPPPHVGQSVREDVGYGPLLERRQAVGDDVAHPGQVPEVDAHGGTVEEVVGNGGNHHCWIFLSVTHDWSFLSWLSRQLVVRCLLLNHIHLLLCM